MEVQERQLFPQKLHEVTGIELIHLDKHYWQPNWVETNKDEWEKKVNQLSDKEKWIIDGNYGGTMDIRIKKADVVIFMDRTRWLCLYRVMKRVISNYGKTRKDMGEGCREKFSWEFMKYVYNYNKTRRPKILEKLSKVKSIKDIVILRSDQEIKDYLESTKKRHATLHYRNRG